MLSCWSCVSEIQTIRSRFSFLSIPCTRSRNFTRSGARGKFVWLIEARGRAALKNKQKGLTSAKKQGCFTLTGAPANEKSELCPFLNTGSVINYIKTSEAKFCVNYKDERGRRQWLDSSCHLGGQKRRSHERPR